MYSKKELIHSISFLANAAYDIQADNFGDLQGDTTNIVNATINDAGVQTDIGVWTQVWGPIVFSNNPTSKTVVADNTMMLVYNEAANLFVVGIAGTNVVSTYGFLQEDFKVNSLVKWSDVVKRDINNSGSIAEGTSIGLDILVNTLKGPELTVDNGNGPEVPMITALHDYIEAHNITGAEVAVTGHSLGGALAPAMAMYLKDTGDGWNKDNNVTVISAWPTAGPTPGNSNFAIYVAGQMGDNYQSYYNPIDVIPQAWQAGSLELIPDMYSSDLDVVVPDAGANTVVGALAVGASINRIHTQNIIPYAYVIDYEQIQPWNVLPNSSYNSDIQTNLITKLSGAGTLIITSSLHDYFPYLKYLLLFLNQMMYQHTKAYNTLLEIDDFMSKYSAIKNNILNTTEEARIDDAFSIALKKYYNLPDLKQIAENANTQKA